MKVVLVLRYLHYLLQKTQKQISDKIQQISDIFQQNISDIFQQTDISMMKSSNRHFGHIQAYFFGLIQHAPFEAPYVLELGGESSETFSHKIFQG